MTGEACGGVGADLVDREMVTAGDGAFFAVAFELERAKLAGGGVEIGHHFVGRFHQVIRRLRRAGPGEVGGGCAGDHVQFGDAARDQRLVDDVAAAQHAVDVFGNEVRAAVGHAEFQLDVGVAGLEVGQGGDDDGLGDGHRKIHAQATLG
jgi:hypothetical protein